jgi:hypothetical protein
MASPLNRRDVIRRGRKVTNSGAFTGAADVPDVAASPMPVAAILAIKIVRMVTSPSISTTLNCVSPKEKTGAQWPA